MSPNTTSNRASTTAPPCPRPASAHPGAASAHRCAVSAHPRPAGFTLVEVMVSVGILGVLVLFLFGALQQSTDVIRRGSARVDSFGSARAALDFLSRELAQTVRVRAENLPMENQSTNDSVASLYLDRQSQDGVFYSQIFALTPINDALTTARDIVEVGYYMEFKDERWQLRRSYSAEADMDAFENPTSWWNAASNPQEVIGNVALFYVQAYERGAQAGEFNVSDQWLAAKKGTLPVGLHVRLGVVSETDAQAAWRAPEVANAATPRDAWLEYVQTNGYVRVFETLVTLPLAN